jgi:hypothetical protein
MPVVQFTADIPSRISTHDKEAEIDRALDRLTDEILQNEISLEALTELLPGPLLGPPTSIHSHPFEDPDPVLTNMLREMDASFASLMNDAPMFLKPDTPNSCEGDLQHYCRGRKDKLHCLAGLGDILSPKCRKDVGKSVPFRCGDFIDNFCDILEEGVLNCLTKHLKDLSASCRDSVVATHHVISKANTQKAAVINKTNGVRRESQPDKGKSPWLLPLRDGLLHPLLKPSMLPSEIGELLRVAEDDVAARMGVSRESLVLFLALVVLVIALWYVRFSFYTGEDPYARKLLPFVRPGSHTGEDMHLLKYPKIPQKIELPVSI